MEKENIIVSKSYAFSIRIVKLHRILHKERHFELSSQLLRSGTSIGANVEEAIGGISRKDFSYKLTIAYKEARETKYWLRLLRDTGIIDETLANPLLFDCEELLKILFSIIKSTKATN